MDRGASIFVSVSSLKINQGLGRRDILDRPRGDGKDGLCVTSFYGGNHLNSLKIRPTRKHFFLIVSILC